MPLSSGPGDENEPGPYNKLTFPPIIPSGEYHVPFNRCPSSVAAPPYWRNDACRRHSRRGRRDGPGRGTILQVLLSLFLPILLGLLQPLLQSLCVPGRVWLPVLLRLRPVRLWWRLGRRLVWSRLRRRVPRRVWSRLRRRVPRRVPRRRRPRRRPCPPLTRERSVQGR